MGLYDNKNQLNREAAQIALEVSRATEKDIIELLNSFVPTFKSMQKKYYTFAYGKIKEQKTKINELTKSLQTVKMQSKNLVKLILYQLQLIIHSLGITDLK